MVSDRGINSHMFGICIESSHSRGMGHLFRALNLGRAFSASGLDFIIYLNLHNPAVAILKASGFRYRIIDDLVGKRGWEEDLIKLDGIEAWIDDRLAIDVGHANRIKEMDIPLVTFDDTGKGAALADLNVAALVNADNGSLRGKRVLQGYKYLILNSEIEKFKRHRTQLSSILVSMGGSDTHGVTPKVLQSLRKMSLDLKITVILGPGFTHFNALDDQIFPNVIVKNNVPSLIEEFSDHDLAITGGGITPFEANASGLPCFVIANETFEIAVGKELSRIGSSMFLGHYSDFIIPPIDKTLALDEMSKIGLEEIGIDGTQRVMDEILRLKP